MKSPRTLRRLLLLAAFWILPLAASEAQLAVLGELSHDREALTGEQYEGTITIKNDTGEPQEAKIYQTDYLFFCNGTNRYGEPGSHPRSNAPWIRFSPSYAEVPARGTATVHYSVTVPADSTHLLRGTYWSMLMVEAIPPGSGESSKPRKGKTQMGIQQTIRYGIQIATTITGTGAGNVKFLGATIVSREAKTYLQVDVENTGERLLRPECYVELFDSAGASRGKLQGNRYRMYPGTSVRQMVDLSSVPKGTYKALVVVDGGGDEAFGAQYTLTF